jgi:hypothetical protein
VTVTHFGDVLVVPGDGSDLDGSEVKFGWLKQVLPVYRSGSFRYEGLWRGSGSKQLSLLFLLPSQLACLGFWSRTELFWRGWSLKYK